MSALEKVLALRPANAAARLGSESVLPLLNPRDLLRAAADQPSALLCVPVPAPVVIPAMLRAARDRDAAIGLAAAHRPGQREGASAFFGAVRSVADEICHRRPLFLQAGPIRVAAAEERALAQLSGEVYRFIEAGFTLLSFDVEALPQEAAVAAVAELGRAPAERELPLEVTLPGPGPLSADSVRSYLEALAAKGPSPALLRIRSTALQPPALDPASEPEPDFQRLAEVATAAAEYGVQLSLDDRGTPLRRLSAWPAAGIRKIDVGEPFAALALSRMPKDVAARIRERAAASGLPVCELLGQLDDPLAGAGDAARERVEALCYGEGCELLDALGAQGGATKALEFLAEKAGY